MILDYSTARPSVAQLKALGVTGVIRYLGWDGQPGYQNIGKNLTLAEAHTLLAAGFEIGLTFEYAADAAAHGAAQGTKDGTLASQQVAGLGLVKAGNPVGVFYAVDFDIPDYAPALANTPVNARAKLGPVAAYFDAIRATKPNHEVAAYGGYWAVKRLLDAGLVKKAWQTIAWSGGQWDSRVVLRQLVQQVLGADVDILEVTGSHPDWGQWPRPVIPPQGPFPHIADGAWSLAQIAASRNTTEAHLLSVAEGMLKRAPLLKGTQWWSSSP